MSQSDGGKDHNNVVLIPKSYALDGIGLPDGTPSRPQHGDNGYPERSLTVAQRTRIVKESSWGMVGGLETAKQEIMEAVEWPRKYKELYDFYNRKATKGILLSGPPGCGKTLLARTVASSIAEMAGEKFQEDAFISVKGPEMLSPWVGETERATRELFKKAKEFSDKNGYQAVIFIDEADSVIYNRRQARHTWEVAMIEAWLTEMDGLEANGALILLATNQPERLDPAVLREGRIDKKVYIPRPNLESAVQIFFIHTKGKPLCTAARRIELCHLAAKFLYSDKFPLYQIRDKKGEQHTMYMRDIVSGAMIENLVEEACILAITRDRVAWEKEKKATGVMTKDVVGAIYKKYQSNLTQEHSWEMEDFCSQRDIAMDAFRPMKGVVDAS